MGLLGLESNFGLPPFPGYLSKSAALHYSVTDAGVRSECAIWASSSAHLNPSGCNTPGQVRVILSVQKLRHGCNTNQHAHVESGWHMSSPLAELHSSTCQHNGMPAVWHVHTAAGSRSTLQPSDGRSHSCAASGSHSTWPLSAACSCTCCGTLTPWGPPQPCSSPAHTHATHESRVKDRAPDSIDPQHARQSQMQKAAGSLALPRIWASKHCHVSSPAGSMSVSPSHFLLHLLGMMALSLVWCHLYWCYLLLPALGACMGLCCASLCCKVPSVLLCCNANARRISTAANP